MTSTDAARASRRIRNTYNLVNAVAWFASVLPMAVTVLFAQSRGFSIFEVGLYSSLYAITVAALEIPTGGLADAIGRKRVAMLSYGLSMVASGILLFAFSLPVLLIFAFVHGASRALGSGSLQAWFVDALMSADPTVDLQPPLAMAGTFELLALAAATLIGGTLPTLFHGLPTSTTSVLTPLAMPILASVVMTTVATLLVALLVREPKPTRDVAVATTPHVADSANGASTTPVADGPNAAGAGAASGTAPANLVKAILGAFGLAQSNPTILLLLGIEAMGGFAVAGIETFWQPFFAQRLGPLQDQTWLFGVLLAGSFAAGMVGNLLAIPVTRWLGRRYGLVAALFQSLRIAAFVLLALQSGPVLATAFFWLTYLGMGSTNSPLATLFNLQVPAARRSLMLSVLSMSGFVGAFAGSLLLGAVAERSSISVAWLIASAVSAASILLLLRLDRTRPPVGVSTSATRPIDGLEAVAKG